MNRYLVMTAAVLAGIVVLAGAPAGAGALPGPGTAAAVIVSAAFSGLLASTGLTPAEIREKLLAIVDDLFMPLVAVNRAQPAPGV